MSWNSRKPVWLTLLAAAQGVWVRAGQHGLTGTILPLSKRRPLGRLALTHLASFPGLPHCLGQPHAV